MKWAHTSEVGTPTHTHMGGGDEMGSHYSEVGTPTHTHMGGVMKWAHTTVR